MLFIIIRTRQWSFCALISLLFLEIGAFAQTQNETETENAPAKADTIRIYPTFDLPRIIEVLRPHDIGDLDTDDKHERQYYINAGSEVSINRGDTLNVYREKTIHPSVQSVRVYIGTMAIQQSFYGSSLGHFTPGGKISMPIVKFKVALESDLVVPRLAIDSGVLFKPGEYSLTPAAAGEFEKVATFVRNFSPSKLLIEGHTDSDGDDEKNKILSKKRAEAVAKYLAEGYDFIKPGMLEARGYGETQPIAPNDTPENKKLNRRIEAIIWQ